MGETFNMLREMAGGEENATYTYSAECKKYGGNCLVVPLPKDIDPSGDIVFVVHQLPSNYDWIGRFVDLETGFFVEVINQGQFAKQVYPLKQCVHDGTLLNVPGTPGRYLDKTGQYSESDFLYGAEGEEAIAVYLNEYDCERCTDFELSPEGHGPSSQPGHMRDNFGLTLLQAANISGGESWIAIDAADVVKPGTC